MLKFDISSLKKSLVKISEQNILKSQNKTKNFNNLKPGSLYPNIGHQIGCRNLKCKISELSIRPVLAGTVPILGLVPASRRVNQYVPEFTISIEDLFF